MAFLNVCAVWSCGFCVNCGMGCGLLRIGVAEVLEIRISHVQYLFPPWRVTFDPSHALPLAWQKVKREAVSITEADYLCGNLLAAGPRATTWSGRGCVKDVLPHPYMI